MQNFSKADGKASEKYRCMAASVRGSSVFVNNDELRNPLFVTDSEVTILFVIIYSQSYRTV